MNESAETRYCFCSSPVGELLLTSSDGMITGLYMSIHRGGPAPRPKPEWGPEDRSLRLARQQLQAFFAGELRAFDLPLQMTGTPFQKQVWEGLLTIPYGTTISYAELAARIGRPGASRAVGAANGRNPIGIVVPCHRVIGANGTLTGYGGGLDRKEWLISHEANVVAKKLHPRVGANRLELSV